MKSKVKESSRDISARMVACGVISSDSFQRLSTDQNCTAGVHLIKVHAAQYKIPDTTQFNN